MRPRYLEIEGLQSFKDVQVIDFDKLGETGLFGIFGPTGSGKSTILDAITLALYGNVQRASRGTQGIANTGMNTVKVSFTFDLLKEGERKSYRVERSYRRKKSSDNSVEIKVARLFEVLEEEDRVIADKPGEVNQKVIELIGLQDDDFTRSVVLPQNKFQEFLLMDKARKRDMMERIFYLEEYGRNLTEKASRKLSSIKYKLSGIEGAVSTLGEMSEIALIEAESALQKARESRERTDAELKLAEAGFNQAREVWGLITDLEVVSGREEEYLQGMEEFQLKKYLHDRACKAESIAALIEKYQESEKSLKDTLQQLEEVNARIPGIEEQLSKVRQEQGDFRREVELQKPLLIERKSRLMEAVDTTKEVKVLESTLNELRESYKKLKGRLDLQVKEIEAKKLELEKGESVIHLSRQELDKCKVNPDYRQQVQACVRLEEELGKVEGDRETHRAKIEELLRRVTVAENGLQQLGNRRIQWEKELEELRLRLGKINDRNPGERDKLLKEGEQYHKLTVACDALKFIQGEIEGICTRKRELEERIKAQGEELHRREEHRSRVEAEYVKAKAELEETRKQKELDTAVALAKLLAEGAPCPVCGSTSHPMPAYAHSTDRDEVDALFVQAQKAMDHWEKSLRDAEGSVIKSMEQVKNSESQYNQLLQDLLVKEDAYAGRCSELPEDMRKMGVKELGEYIGNLNEQRLQRLEELDTWEKSKSEVEAEINRIQSHISGQKAEEASGQGEVRVNRENLHQLQQELETINLRFEQLSTEYHSLLQLLNIASAAQELHRLDANQKRADQLQKEIDSSESSLKTIRTSLEKLEEQRRSLVDELGEVKTQGEIARVRKEETEKKLVQLTRGNDIEAEQKRIENLLSEYEQREMDIETRVKVLDAEYNSTESRKQMLENQKSIYSKAQDQERIRLDDAVKEKGFSGMEEVQRHRLSEMEREKLQQEMGQYEELGNNIQAQKKLLMAKLQGRSLSEEQWLKINQDFEALRQQKEAIISTFENARSTYLNYKKNFEQWVILERERQLYSRKKEMLEQIQKLLKGNSFIEYISEERLRYIAKEASETLGVLTKYRYSLELDTENGFVIRDNANGGVHRMVSSLSGGETFLTSLSLALALSSQIQLKGQSPLEFFFLDEGFGTLDEELLNTVVDSLERLSSTKKVIGLISHVPELKNRISRRLVVEPPSSDGQGSKVRLEKA
mgnify:CR=1 FL=1